MTEFWSVIVQGSHRDHWVQLFLFFRRKNWDAQRLVTGKVSSELVIDVSFRYNSGLEKLMLGQMELKKKMNLTFCEYLEVTFSINKLWWGKGSVSHRDCGACAWVCQPQEEGNSIVWPVTLHVWCLLHPSCGTVGNRWFHIHSRCCFWIQVQNRTFEIFFLSLPASWVKGRGHEWIGLSCTERRMREASWVQSLKRQLVYKEMSLLWGQLWGKFTNWWVDI